jgi:hypothetical protein
MDCWGIDPPNGDCVKTYWQPIFSISSAKWRRGPGRGGVFLLGIPLSSILSPLVPRGARKKDKQVLRQSQQPNPLTLEYCIFFQISVASGGFARNFKESKVLRTSFCGVASQDSKIQKWFRDISAFEHTTYEQS